MTAGAEPAGQIGTSREVFLVALRLGLTSFGGPVAHLGYFREAYVVRLRWLDTAEYADLVALCQMLPGPASSQVGMAIGLKRAGHAGAVAAWLGFAMPSSLLLACLAIGLRAWPEAAPSPWLVGLRTAAVAVVFQALSAMIRTSAPDRARATLAAAACVFSLVVPTGAGQIAIIAAGAVAGTHLFPGNVDRAAAAGSWRGPLRAGTPFLLLFVAVLGGTSIAPALSTSHGLALFCAFFRTGSLVFGGGHVVLPLLQAAVVAPGWISPDRFLAGYGAAQAMPGPLFTFAAYLGAAMSLGPNGWPGALLCLVAIFLPSLLLVAGVLPFWHRVRGSPRVSGALRGVNAAVVGLLGAAFYDPVLTSAIHQASDAALAVAATVLLTVWRAPPWLVVILSSAAGAALATFVR